MNDELRQEYNLRSLQIRKVGEKRKVGENIVKLDSDVAKVFFYFRVCE